jgi:erythromycin esterase-like protein
VGILLAASTQGCAGQLDRTSAEARAVEEICDRQVVVLGELPSHGESRGFQAKARIVELLVAQCGFDVLLFEGPFYEFLGFQEAVNDGRAAPMQLDRAIGGIWLTRELAGWRRSICL